MVVKVGRVGRVGLVGRVGWRAPGAGFSLIELVVAMGIIMAVMAGALAALQSAYGRLGAETEAADADQRLRVAVEALSADLSRAAAIVPDGRDVITAMCLDDGAAHTTTSAALPRHSGDVQVNVDPGCPAGDAACGFRPGDAVVVLDGGGFDPFEVTAVAGSRVTLRHLAADEAGSHPPGAAIARGVVRTFFVAADAGGEGQLVRQDAGGAAVPVVDGIASAVFDYFTADGAALDEGGDPRGIATVGARLRVSAGATHLTAEWRIAPRNLGSAP